MGIIYESAGRSRRGALDEAGRETRKVPERGRDSDNAKMMYQRLIYQDSLLIGTP